MFKTHAEFQRAVKAAAGVSTPSTAAKAMNGNGKTGKLAKYVKRHLREVQTAA